MRDLLVTGVFLAGLFYAFRRPWAGVILWTWISMMNPHRLAWGFAYDAPFAAAAAGVTLLSLLITKDPVRLPGSAPVKVALMFILWMAITTAFAISPENSFDQLQKVFKIQLMTLVALAVLHERQHIQMFVWINALSLGFFGVKGGIFTIATAGGGRIWGPGGFIGGNNEIGLAMLMAIPLLYYLYLQVTKRWHRLALVGAMLLSTLAVLGTQSRGAFLAIMAMGAVLWWRAPRKLMSALIIGVAVTVALAVMSEQIAHRIESISSYEEDSSAVGRLYAWQTAINIANKRPFGAGFAMYTQSISDRYAAGFDFGGKIDAKILQARAAHSIYFQVLGEHGWIGLALFVALGLLTWRMASRIRKRAGSHPDTRWAAQLAGMCQVSLVAYAVGGAFLSLAYFDLPYNIMVIVVVLDRWLARHEVETKSSSSSSPADRLETSSPLGASLAVRGSPSGARWK